MEGRFDISNGRRRITVVPGNELDAEILRRGQWAGVCRDHEADECRPATVVVAAVLNVRDLDIHSDSSVVRSATTTGARSTLRSNARGGASNHARATPPANAHETGSDSHAAPRRPHVHSSGLRAALMKRGGHVQSWTLGLPEQFASQGSRPVRMPSGEPLQAACRRRLCTSHRSVRTRPEGGGDQFQHPLLYAVTNLHNCTPLAGQPRPGREQS